MNILATAFEQDYNANGEIEAGFLFASVKNVGLQAVTVNGVSLDPGKAKAYPFIGKGYTAVPFEVSGSTLRVLKVI